MKMKRVHNHIHLMDFKYMYINTAGCQIIRDSNFWLTIFI